MSDSKSPTTLGDWLTWGAKRLAAAGLDRPRWEARYLLGQATGLAEEVARPRSEIPMADPGPYQEWIERRATGTPPARITGIGSFWGLNFAVGPDTLDPRADSETLVEAVLKHWPEGHDGDFADIGTGTGCLAIAMLMERPALRGFATDLSAGALLVAVSNAQSHGVSDRLSTVQGRWTAPLRDRSIDILLSNPPYIRAGDIAGLDGAVRDHDPRLALDGGADGLDAYRAIIGDAQRVLRSGGLVALEIGWDQGMAVAGLAREAGLTGTRVLPDLGGRDRVVLASVK